DKGDIVLRRDQRRGERHSGPRYHGGVSGEGEDRRPRHREEDGMTDVDTTSLRGLLERLAEGPVICAEGYLFEFERRGYLQAGAYVPEIVLQRPGLGA